MTTFILHYHDTIHMPDVRDLFSEATELAEQGQLDEALALFQALLKTDSNNATLWNNIGIILFRQGKYREAVNAFGQATDVDPEFTNAWFNKSLALVNLGKYLEAIRAFDKVLKINPHDERAREQRDLAQKKIMKSISFSPQSTEKQTKLCK